MTGWGTDKTHYTLLKDRRWKTCNFSNTADTIFLSKSPPYLLCSQSFHEVTLSFVHGERWKELLHTYKSFYSSKDFCGDLFSIKHSRVYLLENKHCPRSKISNLHRYNLGTLRSNIATSSSAYKDWERREDNKKRHYILPFPDLFPLSCFSRCTYFFDTNSSYCCVKTHLSMFCCFQSFLIFCSYVGNGKGKELNA